MYVCVSLSRWSHTALIMQRFWWCSIVCWFFLSRYCYFIVCLKLESCWEMKLLPISCVCDGIVLYGGQTSWYFSYIQLKKCSHFCKYRENKQKQTHTQKTLSSVMVRVNKSKERLKSPRLPLAITADGIKRTWRPALC